MEQDKQVHDILNEDIQKVDTLLVVDTLLEEDMQVDILKGSNQNVDILMKVDMQLVDRLLEDTLLEEVDTLVQGIHVEEGRGVHLDTLNLKIYLSH